MTFAEDLIALEVLAQLRTLKMRARLDPYARDPVAFVTDCVRWPDGGPVDYQLEILGALQEHRKVAVRACHGAAKTATSALAVLWFAITREATGKDWKIVTTAGVWRQLEFCKSRSKTAAPERAENMIENGST